ncbi:MAG: nicotinamide-nucleotide adenylyltransferase [Candidatus Aenigmatarchaeota archaeon]
MKKKKAIFIGRFQPIHFGHVKAIKEAIKRFDLTIVVGSTNQKRSFENPFSFKERKEMISRVFRGIRIVGVPDTKNNGEWVRMVKRKVKFDVVISGSKWVNKCFKRFNIRVIKPKHYKRRIFKGEEIRRRIVENKKWVKLVPKAVVSYIRKIKGIERIKKLYGKA